MTNTILEGEVGPELEAYVNALLERIRELEAAHARLNQDVDKAIEEAWDIYTNSCGDEDAYYCLDQMEDLVRAAVSSDT